MVARRGDLPNDCFCGQNSHRAQRLAHGGQRWILESRGLNIVEPNYGDILGNAQAGFAYGSDRADRRNVVERKDCREWRFGGEQTLCREVTGIVRG
jgi:hypothetical protein